jgi:hypothetical protein
MTTANGVGLRMMDGNGIESCGCALLLAVFYLWIALYVLEVTFKVKVTK